MSSRRTFVLRSLGLIVAGLGAVAIQSPQAEAGAFFGRLFGRNNCPQCYQQQVPVQAAPNSAAPAGSYQSNSFEPNASAPAAVAPVAAPRYSSPAPSRSSYEQFRGDRKALGKF